MRSNNRKPNKKEIPKGILVIKGNFTQRQFESLAKIWDNLQNGKRLDWTLPTLRLSEKDDIGVLYLNSKTGKFEGESIFGCRCKCKCKCDKDNE